MSHARRDWARLGRSTAPAVLALLAIFAASCSAPTRQKIVGVLFDDPPASADSLAVSSEPVESPELLPLSPIDEGEEISYVVHPPYEDHECGECHALDASYSFDGSALGGDAGGFVDRSGARLRFPRETLCFECHDDKTEESLEDEGEYVHPPAADGDCLECHDPHRSRHASLLREGDPFASVCWECHDADEYEETEAHARPAGAARHCLDCHEAHVSGREFLLRADWRGEETP